MWNIFRRTADETFTAGPFIEPAVVPVDESQPPPPHRNIIATIDFIGPVAVATLTVTELTQDDGVVQLTELLDDLAQSGAKHFVLDVCNVQHMDSSCLGCLVEALNRMAADGGRIALVNADHSVAYLFRMTRLDRVFPICSDVMAALKAMERASSAA
jgi:anti-anti-sigma factor